MDAELAQDFLNEAGEMLEPLGTDLMGLAADADADRINRIFRAFHTVKGGAGFLGFTEVVNICHAAEDVVNALRSGKLVADRAVEDALLSALNIVDAQLAEIGEGQAAQAAPASLIQDLKSLLCGGANDAITDDEFEALLDQLHGGGAPAAVDAPKPPPAKAASPAPPPAGPDKPAEKPSAKKGASADTSLRVETKRVDAMVNLAGELVLARNRLKTLSQGTDPALLRAVKEIDQVTSSLQGAVMRLRLQPIGKLFSRYPRIARDLARTLGKDIEIALKGETVELDKSLVEGLGDPLVHLVRNSVDHGVESPEKRRAAGKNPQGTVRLEAEQHGDHIVILIADDGGGIDPELICRKAIEKGLIDQERAARLTPRECLDLIFLPGFSTKQQVSDISGRGVGMDVVRSRLTELGGTVEIDSKLGEGSVFRLRVPLTLAVLPALMLGIGGRPFALPLSGVCDVSDYIADEVQELGGKLMHCGRRGDLPLTDLRHWVGAEITCPGRIVSIKSGDQMHALLVDEVSGREEIVIKPLGKGLRGMPGFAGATVTGDGRVALIIDPEQVSQLVTH